MTTVPLPADLPPLNIRALTSLIHRAPCAASPDLFFGPDAFEEELTADHAARVAAAKEICAACPARLACLAYALKTRPESGVWGGLDADAGELAYLVRAAARPGEPPADRWTRTPDHHILIGGIPGQGKSGAARVLTTADDTVSSAGRRTTAKQSAAPLPRQGATPAKEATPS